MAGRPPNRGGQCGAAGPSRAPRNPDMTRAAKLRQAKSAAFVKEQAAKDNALAARAEGACGGGPRKPRVSKCKLGPPPAEPRRIQMTKPGMTKAMMARMKHAQEFAQNISRDRNEATFQKKQIPVRRPTGDGRLGPDPRRRPAAGPPPRLEPEEWRPQGALQEAAAANPGVQRLLKMREERMAASRAKKNPPCEEAGPSLVPGACPKGPPRGQMPHPQAQSTMQRNRRMGTSGMSDEPTAISEKTCQLAQSMNAEVLQAEPVGEGPVQNIVIPPGAVSQCRTTIVALPSQQGDTSGASNRSMQIIAETLDDQDAMESAAVNNRLSDLQNARRDFVMAVANVGNNVIHLSDNPPTCPAPSERGLYHLPQAEDDMFKIEYGRDHPSVMAAREYAMKTRAAMQERETQMRIDREFQRAARQECGLRMDVPLEQEILEGDISFEEDESGVVIPCASSNRPMFPPIPRKHVAAVTEAISPDELERFFNIDKYPTQCEAPVIDRPPLGREGLNQDLWGLEDPWYRECSQPDMPDLIDFNDY